MRYTNPRDVQFIDAINTFYEESQDQDEDGEDKWIETLLLNGNPLEVKLDTGAQANVISLEVLKKVASNTNLKKTPIVLEDFHEETVKPLGEIRLECEMHQRKAWILFSVVKTNRKTLLGLKACKELDLVHEVSTNEEKKQEFIENKDVFEGLGQFPVKYRIETKEGAVPVIKNCRRVQNSIMPKYQEFLDLLEEKKIIKKLESIDKDTYLHNLG